MRPSGTPRTTTRKDVLTAFAAATVFVAASALTTMLVPARWMLAVLAALFVAYFGILAIPDAQTAWRLRRGRCSSCGYDRRGIESSSPCPECGNTP
jgi:hypothetical protein